jgi:hypothetical protein
MYINSVYKTKTGKYFIFYISFFVSFHLSFSCPLYDMLSLFSCYGFVVLFVLVVSVLIILDKIILDIKFSLM